MLKEAAKFYAGRAVVFFVLLKIFEASGKLWKNFKLYIRHMFMSEEALKEEYTKKAILYYKAYGRQCHACRQWIPDTAECPCCHAVEADRNPVLDYLHEKEHGKWL